MPRLRRSAPRVVRPSLLVVLLLLITSGALWAGPRDVNDNDTIETSHPNWMRWIPDSTPIHELSIPGTHDTMAWQINTILIDHTTETQSLDLAAQLNAGIRSLDIRTRRTGTSFAMHHGSVFLGTFFGADCLQVCADFLQANPTEVILMRLKKDEHDAQDGSLDHSQIFENYRNNPAYSPYIWRPADPDSAPDFPTVGEARGKIVIMQNWSRESGYDYYGPTWNGTHMDVEDNYDVSSGSRWGYAQAQLDAVDADTTSSTVYVTHLSGTGSTAEYALPPFGPYPKRVANATNPDCLEYLFERNQANRRTGILHIDFPGAALIDVIIAHNFRLAPDPFALGSDFEYVVNNLAYSTTDECDDRVSQMKAFFDHMLPSLWWHVICSATQGCDNWGYHVTHEGLFKQSDWQDGHSVVVMGTSRKSTYATSSALATFVEANLPTSGSACSRATALRSSVIGAFPGPNWSCLVKKSPGGFSNWAYWVHGTIYGHEWHQDGEYAYLVWGVDPNDPPVAEAGGPYVVNEGTTVTFDGSGSSDLDRDALSYRWDFTNDGTYDTGWSSSATTSRHYADDHTATVKLQVRDTSLETDTDTASLIVNNVRPSATFGLTGLRPTGLAECEDLLTMRVDFSDPGVNDTHTVRVDWGDGTVHTGGDAGLGTLAQFTSTNAAGNGGLGIASHRYSQTGDYTLAVSVTDKDGGVASRTYAVSVRDTTPPTLTCDLQRTILWPARGGLVPLGFSAATTDICDPNPTLRVTVYSNEANGAAPYSPDGRDTNGSAASFALRAERRYPGPGRVYLVVVTATDAAGNMTMACKSVTVPLLATSLYILRVMASAAEAERACLALGDGSAPAGYTELIHTFVVTGP